MKRGLKRWLPKPWTLFIRCFWQALQKGKILIFWNCMACVHFHRKLWSLGNTNIIPFPGFSFFSLLVFNTSLQCRTSKPVSVPRLGCLGPTELQLPHNQLSSRCLWSGISSRKAAMEEITLPVVMTVRSAKVLIMSLLSVCRSAGILYGEMQPDEKPPLGRRMSPFGIWWDQLGQVQAPYGKCGRKLSLTHGVVELLLWYNA